MATSRRLQGNEVPWTDAPESESQRLYRMLCSPRAPPARFVACLARLPIGGEPTILWAIMDFLFHTMNTLKRAIVEAEFLEVEILNALKHGGSRLRPVSEFVQDWEQWRRAELRRRAELP